jgi:hypothetical protein
MIGCHIIGKQPLMASKENIGTPVGIRWSEGINLARTSKKGVLDPVKIALLYITCFYERANHGVAADPQFPHPKEAPPLPLLHA